MSATKLHPLAGRPAPANSLTALPSLMTAYFSRHPDAAVKTERIAFGTSGHRGTSLQGSFNEDHIAAISQAIAEYRTAQGITGPLFLGMDTHGLSQAAWETAVEVLAANEVKLRIDAQNGYTPTPAVSLAILEHNGGKLEGEDLADGIVITPSHNPPSDGGFKYNPPNGGPADTGVTSWIETRANDLLEGGLAGVRRMVLNRALAAERTRKFDFRETYVAGLGEVIDFEVIRSAGLRIGVDPMGNAAVSYWPIIAERYGLELEVVNQEVDASFRFMRLDWDGKIRMDCSSPYAMAGLVALKDGYDIAFGNDTDVDRHGIVTRSSGLLNPNHFLAVAIEYLFTHRPEWGKRAAVGKTMVSSSMIDRVVERLGRRLVEVPVGFKWFAGGLFEGSLGFGGEESAGASFLRRNGRVWTTDKDGPVMGLLAAEMTAVTGKDPGVLYGELTEEFGSPVYERIDAAATSEEKAALARLSPEQVKASELAADKITAMQTSAPGNGAALGGLKVSSARGWFAARPSGTENVYKIYAESFVDAEHLRRIQEEAQQIVGAAIGGGN